jgi:hypothetical protein
MVPGGGGVPLDELDPCALELGPAIAEALLLAPPPCPEEPPDPVAKETGCEPQPSAHVAWTPASVARRSMACRLLF